MEAILAANAVDPHRRMGSPDLVDCFVIVVPDANDAASVASIAPDVVRLLSSTAIRLLDVVLVTVDEHGTAAVIEIDSLPEFAALDRANLPRGAWLSKHDIELVAMSLRPVSTGVVVVAEHRWAAQVSKAARAVGGEVRVGERIPPSRVEVVLRGAREDST